MKSLSSHFFVLFMVLLLPFLTACERIESGNVGVVKKWNGEIIAETLPGGDWYFDGPSITIYEYTAKPVALSLQDLRAVDKNNLLLQDFDVDVFYQVNPADIGKLVSKYRNDAGEYQGDYVAAHSRVLRSAREAAYNAAVKHESLKIAAARPTIAKDIAQLLQTDLDASDKGSFTVMDVNIRSLVPDERLSKASSENAEMQNKIDREKQAVQVIEQTALANEKLARTITPQLLEYKRIENIGNCLKAGSCVFIQGNATPIVNLSR